MKQYRKTEYNIQFRKKSFIILMFVLTVFEILLFLAMDNSFDFLILTNKTELFSESTFPPVLNAILYELALLLPTFFVFWGFFSVKYDQNIRCNVLRAISFDCKKTVKCQYEWGIYMMLYFILVGIGVSLYWQNKFNDYIGGAYEFVCSFDFIVKLLYKILCIALASTISISAGVFAGDGDLMEGISHEALSLAGHLQLKNLIIFFDNNKITIDGSTDLTCSDDHIKKFESYGFFVQEIDGHNFEEIHDAISNAQKSEIPSIIMCNTKIGKGIDAFEGTSTIHGKIPPHDVLNAVREKNFWTPFSVPNDVLNEWRSLSKRSQKYYLASKKISDEIEKFKSEPFFDDFGFDKLKMIAVHDARDISTKQSLNEILNNLAMKKFISGSADLSGSNGTKTKSMLQINSENFAGNYIHYGIREHAMGAIVNGISLNKIFKACAATFLSFSDYMREPIRLSALMNVNSIFVFSHDSIFIGEDGPTHQPIEQLDSLRIIPNFYVWRPADFLETAFAFQEILSANHPSALILTRQEVQNLHYKKFLNDEIGKGGYVFDDFEFLKNVSRETIQNSNNYIKKILLIATGSELALAVKIKDILKNHKIDSRIISIPCFERFFENDDGYVQKVFCGDEIDSRIFIEASTGICFDRYIKRDARDFSITIDRFGASGSKKDLENYFGFNEKISEKILNRIS